MNRKTKKTLKWVAIGLALGILTMITLVVLFFTLFLFGGPATRTTNIKKYPIIFENYLQSGLIVFPEEIAADVQDTEFSYYYKDTWDDPTVSIFLQCTYTPEDYEAEVQRLQSTKKDYGGTERVLLQEEGENYSYPAYIAVENHHHQYEYALLSGENQITYIYTSFFWKDDIKFDQKYLPKDFMKEQEDTFYDGYSIYIKHIDTPQILCIELKTSSCWIFIDTPSSFPASSSFFVISSILYEESLISTSIIIVNISCIIVWDISSMFIFASARMPDTL